MTHAVSTLWRRYHALLSPPPLDGPVAYAERERVRRGGLLGTLLAANLPLTAAQALSGLSHWGWINAVLALFFLIQVVCARLNHARGTALACRLFLGALFLVGAALMAAFRDAVPIPGIIAGIFTVLLSGFLVSRRAPYTLAALSTAAVAAHALRHPHALPLPPGHPDQVLPLAFLAPGFFFAMLAVITSLGAGSLEGALARADEADVLERRVGERTAALAESRERLHFALKGADLGAWSHDIVGGRLTLSEECCRLYGLPPGRSPHGPDELLLMIHPDDRPALHEKVQGAAREGGRYQHEFRIVLPDGGARWLAIMGRFQYDEATRWPLRVDGTVMDVTERKALEAERERLLAEAVERADHDPLTGLLNHRAFHRRLDEEADRALQAGRTLCVAMLDLDNFKFFNDAYGHLAGDDVLRQVAAALRGACRPHDTLARFGGDEFALLLPGVTAAEAACAARRLQDGLDALGYRPPGHDVTIPLSLSIGLALLPDDSPTRLGALARADERLYRAKTGASDRGEAERLRARLTQHMEGFPMLDALVTAVDNKDRYTRRHSEDVMAYCLQIAREQGLDEAACHTLAVAALLHDVGKIGVPDHVLRKPGSLTEEEAGAVRQHPVMGAVIVGAVPGLEDTLGAVRHHHERWDGGGYPGGLAGEAIPPLARLMAVADAFSAMTTDRPYRQGMAEQRALAILREGRGRQWDPACVDAFLRARGSALGAGSGSPDPDGLLLV